MPHDDALLTAYAEAQALMRQARSDQLEEALRLLACEVAYAQRYHECLPLGELVNRIAGAATDATSMELVADGQRHLAAVLRRLHVTLDESAG